MSGIQAVKSLKHFAGAANELQRLRDRVEELEELLGVATLKNGIARLPLTLQQATIVGLIFKMEIASRSQIYIAVYGMRHECDMPGVDRIIDTQLCKARKILFEKGITIQTKWGFGWWMKSEDKAKLAEWVESLR